MGLLQALLIAAHQIMRTISAYDNQGLTELLAKSSNDQRWHSISKPYPATYWYRCRRVLIVWHVLRQVNHISGIVNRCARWICDQGARVLYLGNEEETIRTMLRSVQAAAGTRPVKRSQNAQASLEAFACVEANVEMKDVVEWDLDRIDATAKMKSMC